MFYNRGITRNVRALLFLPIFALVYCQDDVVTEVVSSDMLDMELDEMAAMDDDIMQMDLGAMLMTEPVMHEPVCMSGKTELVFLLDGSRHVTDRDFIELRDWLMLLVEAYDLVDNKNNLASDPQIENSEKTRVALVVFSDSNKVELSLDESTSRMKVWDTIARIEKMDGASNISRALDYARTDILNRSRTGALKIVVLVTASGNYDETAVEMSSTRLKQSGVRLLAVTVGDDVTRDSMQSMTSQPGRKSAFTVKKFSDLEKIRKKMKWKICRETAHKAKMDHMPPKENSRCGCKDGKPGPPGVPGQRGQRGHKGERGERGIQGKTGSRGKQGEAGVAGLPGPPGLPGIGALDPPDADEGLMAREENDFARADDVKRMIKESLQEVSSQLENDGVSVRQGLSGTNGLPGLKGDIGPPGIKGEQGLPGLDGDTGPMGLTGPPGLPGAPGESVDMEALNGKLFTEEDVIRIATKVCKSMIDEHERKTEELSRTSRQRPVRGPPGQRGYPGPPGPQGYEGSAGSRGYPGPAGPKGSRGDAGPIGDKGERGTPGMGIEGPRGPAGAPGKSRPGISGQPGQKGDRGLRGKKGPRGSPGKQGTPGRCSTQQCTSTRNRRSISSAASQRGTRSKNTWWPW